MPDNNGEEQLEGVTARRSTDKVILQQIFKMNDTLQTMSQDIAEIKTIKPMVDKHEQVIYGDQEKMSEGGIVFTLNGLKKEASMFATAVSTGISTAITVVIALVTRGK